MKQFKNIFIFGVTVLFIVGVMIIHYAKPSATVDFSGEIHNIVISDAGEITLYAVATFGGNFLFRIDASSKLENCCGEKIDVEDLKEGSLIQINYRKYLFKKEKIHTVKELVAFL